MENYFEHKGFYFKNGTPLKLADMLLTIKANKTRIVLDYGDTDTNIRWNEMYDVTGYIGQSTGSKPILLLIHNKRSVGGGVIMTNNILSIKTSIGKCLIYSNCF